MKILLLPYNIASKASITIDALNKIEGVEAKGLFLGGDIKQTIGENVIRIEPVPFSRNPVKWAFQQMRKAWYFRKLIRWADVIHWIWDSAYGGQLDIKYAAYLKKPGLIEWSGSDIRYRERAIELNRYMRDIYDRGYEYAHIETREKSDRIQERFARLGFFPLTTPEMNLYVRKDLFPRSYITLHRLNVKDFVPVQSANQRPLVVHAPTQRVAKGTDHIIRVVEELKTELDFDFYLLENLPRQEAMRLVQQCDIFIDQLMLGSHGLASCEAMAFGKPVLCYIMPAVFQNGLPPECPVVNVTVETMKTELRKLIMDPSLRRETGNKGREYALKYHDADVIARRFADYYREVLALKKN
ncbi:MAG: glycosyltransferase [Sphingobacteriales bacterium]|nr:glycosyltransferase [Sphingobacteriales bacterium]